MDRAEAHTGPGVKLRIPKKPGDRCSVCNLPTTEYNGMAVCAPCYELAVDGVEQDAIDKQGYFWDETRTDRIGPYDCPTDALTASASYGVFLTYGSPDPC